MQNVYVSIVGTQPMAVINPLSVLKKEGYKIDDVKLLTTLKTEETAQSLKQFIQNRMEIPEAGIQIIPISDTDKEQGGRPSAWNAFFTFLNGKDNVFFNTAGGMNFQIAGCIKMAEASHLYFLYPEYSGLHLIKYDNRTITQNAHTPTPPLQLKASDILGLHEIKYQSIVERKSRTHDLFKKLGLDSKMPPGCLKDVKIGQLEFDYIWAENNEVIFLTSLWSSGTKKPGHYLAKARDVINAALERSTFNDLFHRKILVFTDGKSQMERIGSTSKLEMVHIDEKLPESHMKIKLIFALKLDGANLSTGILHTRSTQLILNDSLPSSVLFLDLAKDILPSMIALFSHRPERVVFIYTPGDPAIKENIESIKKNRELLAAIKVKQVEFYPAGYLGLEILDIPKPDEKKIWINITPGLKSHVLFLVTLSNKMGGEIFSMDNKAGVLKNLMTQEASPLSGPDPSALLRLQGETFLNSYHAGKRICKQNHKQNKVWDGILSFIRLLNKQDESIIPLFLEQHSSDGTQRFKVADYKSNNGDATITLEGQEPINFDMNGGEWFESLVGYAMFQCGADDVRCRIRTEHCEEIQKKALKGGYKKPFKDDIDVAALFGSRYFIISCKATEEKNTKKYSKEAKAFANLFGRFAQPMLCFLKYNGEPVLPQNNDGVGVFGYRTFIDPEKMKKFLKETATGRQTTHTLIGK